MFVFRKSCVCSLKITHTRARVCTHVYFSGLGMQIVQYTKQELTVFQDLPPTSHVFFMAKEWRKGFAKYSNTPTISFCQNVISR